MLSPYFPAMFMSYIQDIFQTPLEAKVKHRRQGAVIATWLSGGHFVPNFSVGLWLLSTSAHISGKRGHQQTNRICWIYVTVIIVSVATFYVFASFWWYILTFLYYLKVSIPLNVFEYLVKNLENSRVFVSMCVCMHKPVYKSFVIKWYN